MKVFLRLIKGFEGLIQFLLILTILVVGAVFLITTLNLPFKEENFPFFKTKQESGQVAPQVRKNFSFFLPSSPTIEPTPTISPTPTLTPKEILANLSLKYGPCRYVPILMYHHLLEPAEAKKIGAQNLNVSPAIFEQQINYLIKKGYQTIFLDELMDGMKGNRTLPQKPMVITFDDGYKELYYILYPLMKMKNFKATVFVISQFLDGDKYLSWDQLKEMASNNLLEIGDHTLNHSALTETQGEGFIRDQILSSQKIISERIGRTVKVFAYPYGTYNKTTEKILVEGKFTAGVKSNNTGAACVKLPYEIPRMRIGDAQLSGYGL